MVGAGPPMVVAAIRVLAITLAVVGSQTAGVDIKGPGTTSAAGGHPMAEVDIRVRAITLAEATARTAAAGSRARGAILAEAGIPMGGVRARILAVGGNKQLLTNIKEMT